MNEREGMCGISKRVMLRVELGGEAAVLGGDVVDVLSVTEDLENSVPIKVVVDPGLTSHKGINHR